jgi:hypothetical protein
MSYATSSNFSSILRKGPGGGPHVPAFHDMSMVTSNPAGSVTQSMISYEDGFQNAEFNAITEEERARRRREEKDLKMKEFMHKTKKNA